MVKQKSKAVAQDDN